MGAASSKVARRLPREKPTWAGARKDIPPTVGNPQQVENPERFSYGVSESKDAAIREDAQDPHFAAKLSQLGQVRVDHHMKDVNVSAARTSRMLQSRLQSEEEADNIRSSSARKNRILASDLLELLRQRQDSASDRDTEAVEERAKRHGLDAETFRSVARYVAAPGIEEGSVVKTILDDGTERVTYKVSRCDP
ncbi:hypothetical protein PUNSTDRAFT_77795 [Punctularia strigosozonata HHB-11173 SS5]|uniref:Uncharacterized protein n=1 Tax=Punctularia strigosozonata (strain HHB-11173) TaxID=741275 RepID=R7S1B9_PUNST|nr:uncharacterized protein PUNSTDRAFT_77795 [Punctularia strigosozonata HHB-11173 SS5]EIN03639.1 hypothetical protein PUNSTDRAFT_77795 [Punctularia strigosozonata HHB-11173 SS5]